MWTCARCNCENQEPLSQAVLEQEMVCEYCGTISLWCDRCGAFMEHDEKLGCIACWEFNTDPVIWGDVPWWMTSKEAY